MTFKAKIIYKVDGNHPDIQDMDSSLWYDKIFTYEDEYYFHNRDWTYEEAVKYIKHDLKLVAGGGYNYNHIYDVKFEIEEGN